MSAAHPVVFETPRYLAAPFRLDRARARQSWSRGSLAARRNNADGHGFEILAGRGERCVTKRTIISVLKQEGATLRAYSDHWSVLRCGSSSGGTARILARPRIGQQALRKVSVAY